MKTMKFTNRFMSIIFIATLFMACTDDGLEGPIGPQGPQGEQGVAGPQGPAGEDGEAQGVPGPQGEQGEQGPAGAQGETGPAGPQGPPGENGADGQDGEDGEDGAANVFYSGWITSGFANNIMATTATFEIDAPSLTDEIRNNGIILVYARNDQSGTIYGLPVTFGVFQESYFFRTSQAGELVIRIHSLNVNNIGAHFFDAYRYVLIPGETITGKSKTEEDYAKMSYQEIIAHFNIPE